jgi:hypothetical protein
MIIQTKEEAANYVPLRGRRNTKIAGMLARLAVGEAIIIERGIDWKTKTSPFSLVNAFAKRYNRKFDKAYANDGKGWWIKRIA